MKESNQDLNTRLSHFKQIGYHLRLSGSIFSSDEEVKCDCCGLPTHTKIGYEKDYPNNPDIGLCSNCSEKLNKLILEIL